MENTADTNKRIAKNTILLYIRMLFLMIISLYTSRVILAALGVEDFGTYNVVGGVVTIFTMISGSLQAAISRFITYELGKGDKGNLSAVFSTSIIIQWCLAFIFILLSETLGLWFVNSQLVILEDRMIAANYVYQFSIVTFFINLISVPYNSCIIAHEKMSVYAYISIFEGIGKLIVAFIISVYPFDRLILYSVLLTVIAIVVRIVYGWYCKRSFEECSFKFYYDKSLFKQIFSFAGWNIIGATSAVCRDQGGNILINIFGGPTFNAARGIAIQVSSAVQNFVSNFQTALNPQITKSYVSGETSYMLKLIYNGARFSYFILFLVALPILMNSSYILKIWLIEVPEHTELFMNLVIVYTLIECLSGPLITAMYATGKVKLYQIVVGGFQFLNLPISYIFLKLGSPVEIVFIVSIIISVICLMTRLEMLKPLIGLSIKDFLKNVLTRVITISCLSLAIPVTFRIFHPTNSIFVFVISCFLCLTNSGIFVLLVGCSHDERTYLYKKLVHILSSHRK